MLASLLGGCGGADSELVDASTGDGAVLPDAVGPDAATVDARIADSPDASDATVTCTETGEAIVLGTVAGNTIGPVRRVYRFVSVEGFDVIAIRESVGVACPAVSDPAGERFLMLAFSCPPIRSTTYPVATNLASVCPPEGDGVLALVQQDGGIVVAAAASGSVVIEDVSGPCVTGTFDLSFDGSDALSGAFAAVVCE